MPDLNGVVLVVGPTTGGIGRHVHSLATELVKTGVVVTVVGPAATDATFDWHATGASFVAAPVGSLRPQALAVAVRELRRAARPGLVVHAHAARAGAVAGLARVRPLAVTWHNSVPAKRLRRLAHPLAERVAASCADVTVAVSEDLMARARAAGAKDVRLVGVPAPELPSTRRDSQTVRAELGAVDRPFVLAVARLERQKRLDLLVAATAGWADRADAPVVAVAGTGSQGGRLRRAALELRSPVRLLGRREDVADLLAAADVAVLPSDWEGSPLFVQEALVAGVPLVATAVGGVPDLVGEAAVLIPPGRPERLGSALEEVIGSPELRARLRQAGRQRAAEWPTVAAMVNDLSAIYLDLSSRMS